MVVVVVVVVRSLTGTVGSPSTAGLTVIAAAALVGARLDQVVADEQLQLGGERGVVLTKVAERGAEAGFVGHAAIVGPREPRRTHPMCAPVPRCASVLARLAGSGSYGRRMGSEVGSLGLLDAQRRALTVGLVLVITMVAFEALAVATALPKTVDDLGGVSLYGWAFSAFMLANLIGITVAGHQADARGPAPPLFAGLVLFGAGLVICGAAPSMVVVVAGRAVQGLGAGAVPAVAYVAIGRGYPEALRPRMFAVMSSAWVVPGIVGPGVAGFGAEALSVP